MIGQSTNHVSHYTVVAEAAAELLARNVETAIRNGWQPWGSMSVSEKEGAPLFLQVMVKYADRFG